MKIGFCNGCWDLFHEGHKYFLKTAHEQCDWLIVGVDSDENVRRKGPGRPFQPLGKRLERVSASAYVDSAIPFTGSPTTIIQSLRPEILFRGADQTDEGREHAAQFCVIDRLPGFSTSAKIATLRL